MGNQYETHKVYFLYASVKYNVIGYMNETDFSYYCLFQNM